MTNLSKEKGKKEKTEKNGKRAVFNPKELKQCPHLKELAHEFDPWHSPRRFNSRTLRSRLSLIGLRASHLMPGIDNTDQVSCLYAPLSTVNPMGLSHQVLVPECQPLKEELMGEDDNNATKLQNNQHGYIVNSQMEDDTAPVVLQTGQMGMEIEGNYVPVEQNQFMETTGNFQMEGGNETMAQNIQLGTENSSSVQRNVASMMQNQHLETMNGSSVGMDCENNVAPLFTEQELNEAFEALGNSFDIDDFEPFNPGSDLLPLVYNSEYQGEVLDMAPFTYNQNNKEMNYITGSSNNSNGDNITVASASAINVFDGNSHPSDNSSGLTFPNQEQAPSLLEKSSNPPINSATFNDISIEDMLDHDFQWEQIFQKDGFHDDTLLPKNFLSLEDIELALDESNDLGS